MKSVLIFLIAALCSLKVFAEGGVSQIILQTPMKAELFLEDMGKTWKTAEFLLRHPTVQMFLPMTTKDLLKDDEILVVLSFGANVTNKAIIEAEFHLGAQDKDGKNEERGILNIRYFTASGTVTINFIPTESKE